MYITAAIADEHLTIRERTSSPSYYTSLTYTSVHIKVLLPTSQTLNALSPRRYFEILQHAIFSTDRQ